MECNDMEMTYMSSKKRVNTLQETATVRKDTYI